MAREEARLWRLGDMASEEPMAGFARRRVKGEKAMVSEVSVASGAEIPWHSHPNEQFVLMLEGRLQFDVERADGSRERMVLVAGDVLHLPGNVAHGGLALEDCRAFDIFSPPTDQAGIDRPQGA